VSLRSPWFWSFVIVTVVLAAGFMALARQRETATRQPIAEAAPGQPAISQRRNDPRAAADRLPQTLTPMRHQVTQNAGATETAILAGGCFWGMQEILRDIPGVLKTDVGYTGGTTARPRYGDLHDGSTGHAEAVRIVFDPKKVSYADLLEKWFFRMHDPTTTNRQGNDVGTQYRSAIFFTSPEQQRTAAEVKARVDESGKWKKPLVTQIAAAGPFTPAEGEHQDYLRKHPGGYTCHFLRRW
jgi:peptide methionine sulfoxide reductase msrA/msrB